MRVLAILLLVAACADNTYTGASVTVGSGGSEGRVSTGVTLGNNVTIGGSVGGAL